MAAPDQPTAEACIQYPSSDATGPGMPDRHSAELPKLRRIRCRPVDIAIERAQRAIFHFLPSPIHFAEIGKHPLSSSSSPFPENPSGAKRSQKFAKRSTIDQQHQQHSLQEQILAPFREERGTLLPKEGTRDGADSASRDPNLIH